MYQLDDKTVLIIKLLLSNSFSPMDDCLDKANFNFDTRHPIILLQCSHLTSLIIDHIHFKSVCQSGVSVALCELCERFE